MIALLAEIIIAPYNASKPRKTSSIPMVNEMPHKMILSCN